MTTTTTTLTELLASHGVLLVFLTTFCARVGLPLPAAPLLVVAGGMAMAGGLSAPAVLAASLLANLLGDGVWFWAGRRFGHRVMRLLCRISLSPDACVRQSETLIARWGGRSLLAAKFLPGISVVAAPMAGALGMDARRFIAFDLLAAAIWSLVFLGLGLVFREQIQQVLEALAGAGVLVGMVVVAAVAAWIAHRFWRRRRARRAAGSVRRIGVDEVLGLMARGKAPLFLDVRAEAGRRIDPRRIAGALPLELNQLAAQAAQLPRGRLLVLYCNCPDEASAVQGAQSLAALGFRDVAALVGGMEGWVAAGRAIDRHEPVAAL